MSSQVAANSCCRFLPSLPHTRCFGHDTRMSGDRYHERSTFAQIMKPEQNLVFHKLLCPSRDFFLCGYYDIYATYFLSFLVSFCILESESASGEGQRERVLTRIHYTQRGAWWGAGSRDLELMTWANIESQMFNRLNHPRAPIFCIFKRTSRGDKTNIPFFQHEK